MLRTALSPPPLPDTRTFLRQQKMNVPKLSDVERYPGQRNRNDALEIPRNFDFDADDPGRRYTFKYYSGDEGDDDNGELEWQEVLSCFRCEHRSMQAIQCRRRSCLTLPRCWQHLKIDYNLRIGRTTLIDENGDRLPFKGLFACKSLRAGPNNAPVNPNAAVFRKNDIIAPYVAEVLTREALKGRYPDDEVGPYASRGIKVPVPEWNQDHDGPQPRRKKKGSRRFGHRKKVSYFYIDGATRRSAASLANTCLPEDNCVNNAYIYDSVTAGMFPNLVAIKPIYDGQEIFTGYGQSYYKNTSRHHAFETSPNTKYNKIDYKPCR